MPLEKTDHSEERLGKGHIIDGSKKDIYDMRQAVKMDKRKASTQ